jgi:hypothetical protein
MALLRPPTWTPANSRSPPSGELRSSTSYFQVLLKAQHGLVEKIIVVLKGMYALHMLIGGLQSSHGDSRKVE